MLSFQKRVALIVGASSGIGRATTITLGKLGATVIAAGRRLDQLEQTVADLQNAGITASPMPLDVTNDHDIQAAMEQIATTFSRLDIVVNCAGILEETPFLEITADQWQKLLATNLTGAFTLSQKAARLMQQNRYGRIIHVSSILMGGVGRADVNVAHYTASKAGLVGLTESMAVELAPLGITVNAVAPGYIDTPMTAKIKDTPTVYQQVLDRIPLKRFGSSEEVTHAIAFLASESSSYITGTTLVCDGGYLAA